MLGSLVDPGEPGESLARDLNDDEIYLKGTQD